MKQIEEGRKLEAKARRTAANRSRIREIIEGLLIVEATRVDGYCVDAQHGVIYAGSPEGMTDEHVDMMLELGWQLEFDGESWAKFT